MKLRICDGEHERIVPASIEMVEQVLLSGGSGGTAVLSGRLGRSEVLRRFREFVREGTARY